VRNGGEFRGAGSGAAEDVVGVGGGPLHQGDQQRGEFAAAAGEAVVHARRDHRVGVTVHEPVVLQGPQRLGEHLLADALGAAAQFTPAQCLPGQRGPSPSSLARALAELGRVIKTLHVLEYAPDPAYRRIIHHLLSRGERRNSLARDVFHGQRGQIRRHYQVGQENQLDSLGIMINVIVLWQTVYTQAALDHLAASGYPLDPADVARLTPLGHPTINLDGRYRTTSRPPATGLRPLRID
jgi:hypothetical protein